MGCWKWGLEFRVLETANTQMVFKGTRWYEILRRVFGKRKEQNLGMFI